MRSLPGSDKKARLKSGGGRHLFMSNLPSRQKKKRQPLLNFQRRTNLNPDSTPVNSHGESSHIHSHSHDTSSKGGGGRNWGWDGKSVEKSESDCNNYIGASAGTGADADAGDAIELLTSKRTKSADSQNDYDDYYDYNNNSHSHRRKPRNSNDVVHIDVDEDSSVKEEEKEGRFEIKLDDDVVGDADTDDDHCDDDHGDDHVDDHDHIGAEFNNEDEANIRSTHAPHYDMLTSSQNDTMSQKQAHIQTTISHRLGMERMERKENDGVSDGNGYTRLPSQSQVETKTSQQLQNESEDEDEDEDEIECSQSQSQSQQLTNHVTPLLISRKATTTRHANNHHQGSMQLSIGKVNNESSSSSARITPSGPGTSICTSFTPTLDNTSTPLTKDTNPDNDALRISSIIARDLESTIFNHISSHDERHKEQLKIIEKEHQEEIVEAKEIITSHERELAQQASEIRSLSRQVESLHKQLLESREKTTKVKKNWKEYRMNINEMCRDMGLQFETVSDERTGEKSYKLSITRSANRGMRGFTGTGAGIGLSASATMFSQDQDSECSSPGQSQFPLIEESQMIQTLHDDDDDDDDDNNEIDGNLRPTGMDDSRDSSGKYCNEINSKRNVNVNVHDGVQESAYESENIFHNSSSGDKGKGKGKDNDGTGITVRTPGPATSRHSDRKSTRYGQTPHAETKTSNSLSPMYFPTIASSNQAVDTIGASISKAPKNRIGTGLCTGRDQSSSTVAMLSPKKLEYSLDHQQNFFRDENTKDILEEAGSKSEDDSLHSDNESTIIQKPAASMHLARTTISSETSLERKRNFDESSSGDEGGFRATSASSTSSASKKSVPVSSSGIDGNIWSLASNQSKRYQNKGGDQTTPPILCVPIKQQPASPSKRRRSYVMIDAKGGVAEKKNKQSNSSTVAAVHNPVKGTNVKNTNITLETSNDKSSFRYQETIRGKRAREKLIGFDCAECQGFIDAVCNAAGGSVFNRDTLVQKCSRHRAHYSPPQTPEDFWEMSFVDEREKRKLASKDLAPSQQNFDFKGVLGDERHEEEQESPYNEGSILDGSIAY